MACEQHDDIIRRLNKAELRLDDCELNLEVLKMSDTRSSEQIKMIFKILEEIKITMSTGFRDTHDEIEKIKMRPARFYDGAITALLAAVIGAAVGMFMRGGL